MPNTREMLEKAIKHYKCERDGAIVVLNSGFGNKPGESDLLYRNRKERAQLAIDALKKQIPQKPVLAGDGYADGHPVYDTAYCPICNHEFEEGINDWGSKYCSDCGQALDWSDCDA